jgi:putative transposase
MDKSGANYVGLENINFLLKLAGIISFVEILQIKYLNNLVEQEHRFIKKITKPMMGFKAFHSAKATVAGIETVHMIRKGPSVRRNHPSLQAVYGFSRIVLPLG